MILAYCRVSTEEQGKNTSIPEQERMLRGYAMLKGAQPFDVVVFTDNGVSGSVPLEEREGGKEMLEAARKGDVIVAVKLDRLFRSARDALNTAEDLKRKGIDLVLTDMGNEPVTGNGAAKLFFTLLAAVAEFERDRITERITTGKRAKAKSGGYNGGEAPFGFKKINGKLEEWPAEQEVLSTIRNLMDEGVIPFQIYKQLRAKQLFSLRTNKPFQWKQVRRMIATCKQCASSS